MFESHACHIEIFFDEFFVAGPGRCCQYSSFIVIQLSRPKETRASSESHGGCKTAVKNWSVMEEVVSLLLTNKLFNYVQRLWSYSELFRGRSRIDAGICHPVQHLTISESGKACSPAYGPTPPHGSSSTPRLSSFQAAS